MTGKFTDIMIDLETLGTGRNAPIIQVGACVFDRKERLIGPTFKRNVEPDLKKYDADWSTVKWWLEQDDAARASITGDRTRSPTTHTMVFVIAAMRDFIRLWCEEEFCVWAMPTTFDVALLDNACDVEGWDRLWPHWCHRDVRTVYELAGFEKEDRILPVVPHDAVEDAFAQTKSLFQALDMLEKSA